MIMWKRGNIIEYAREIREGLKYGPRFACAFKVFL
jgi:hypothetical protein